MVMSDGCRAKLWRRYDGGGALLRNNRGRWLLLKTQGCGQDFEFSTSIDLIGVFFLFFIEGFYEGLIKELSDWPVVLPGYCFIDRLWNFLAIADGHKALRVYSFADEVFAD